MLSGPQTMQTRTFLEMLFNLEDVSGTMQFRGLPSDIRYEIYPANKAGDEKMKKINETYW